jgi:gentisate 1,2-dioxygenase
LEVHVRAAEWKADTARSEFYGRLNHAGLAPLWEVLGSLVTSEPRPAALVILWKYSELRPLLMDGRDADNRGGGGARVLVLENPGLRGRSQITGSLYAGVAIDPAG